MSKYVKNQDSNTQWVIDESSQNWLLGKNATITVSGEAAINIGLGSDDNLIKLKGDLVATGAGSEGVRMEGDETLLKIAKSSSTEANDGIRNTGMGNVIMNAGIIDGIAHGIYSDSGMDIRNQGEISGEVAIVSAGPNYIENLKAGVIDGDEVGIRLGPGTSTIVNHGTIRSDDVAITTGGLEDTQLVNTGKIIGDVFFGGGDDVIDTRKGTITGVVDAGDGNDAYYIGKGGGQLTEEIGSGWDEVHSKVSFTLGSNFEGLQLIGKKSIDGNGNDAGNQVQGNAGANTMHGKGGNDHVGGGRGDDMLRGGGGLDDFIFRKGDDKDVVFDFEVGQDQVGIMEFGFETYDDIAPHLSQHGNDTWISLGEGDRLILKDVEMGALAEEMFIFAYPMVM